MESLRIDISATRALTVEGRLVAGETAEVTIGGATPTALYLVAPDQTVVAVCEAFTPTGEGSGGTGFLQLATEQVAVLFAHTPAGRMVAVWALVNDADGVAGAGWIPVVSAPMPDELVDLDIDFFLRASQVGAGLAIVDGKLVCTVNPDNYLTKAEAAATYATQTALAGKYTKPATGIPATDLAAAVQTSLGKADTALQTGPVQSVNSQTGAVSLTGADIPTFNAQTSVNDYLSALDQNKADETALSYALDAEPRDDDPETHAYRLDDRAVNWIEADKDENAIALDFPGATLGKARDFLVYLDGRDVSGTGDITLTVATGNIVLLTPDGTVPSIPKGKITVLYFSEVGAQGFLFKAEPVEVVA